MVQICFAILGIYIPYWFITDYGVSSGLSKAEAAIVLSSIGFSSGVGRIGSGYISSKPWADHIKIHNALLIIGGLAAIAIPFVGSLSILICCAIVFGLATGN